MIALRKAPTGCAERRMGILIECVVGILIKSGGMCYQLLLSLISFPKSVGLLI